MLKGGVISEPLLRKVQPGVQADRVSNLPVDVVDAEQARIAEAAGACAVMVRFYYHRQDSCFAHLACRHLNVSPRTSARTEESPE